MNTPEEKFDTFQKGFVFWEISEPRFGPPDPDDIQRLREWLKGFQLSHAEHPDVITDPLDPEQIEEAGESVAEALDRLLSGHPTLPTLLAMLRWPV